MFFYSSQSCLGLQWFWSSCPFRRWGSRLPLPIAVFRISSRGLCSFLFPDFVPGWLVLRLLRWCSAVSSCFPAFSRLADPCYFYSPALSLLLYSWRLCSSCFPPSRLWSSRLAFHSVTVPLVYSLLLLECSYSPQLFCGSSWVSASCLAPAFGGSLTRVYLFCVFGLYRFGLLPSCSSGVLRPGGCFPWLVSSSMVVFVHSSHVRPLWSCALLPVSSLTSPPWLWLCCFLRLRFVRRLSLSVVFLVPSR